MTNPQQLVKKLSLFSHFLKRAVSGEFF